MSMGKKFRDLLDAQTALPILGTINAYCAILAEEAGAEAIYLSGAGVANASYGLPDLGMTSLTDVLEDVRRIRMASTLPLLVDVDTGWGHKFNIQRTVRLMEREGVAAIHIEDQAIAKRCGHRPNKSLISMQEMGDRIKAAVDARLDPNFVIMARTDAVAVEGLEASLERALFYVECGADMLFPEALASLDEYKKFTRNTKVPVLANLTEFGKTPLFTKKDLETVGVQLLLYPLSAFRAMSQAAFNVYQSILKDGTQSHCLESMQSREELYKTLHYCDYETQLDKEC